jgi:hypothetical protein
MTLLEIVLSRESSMLPKARRGKREEPKLFDFAFATLGCGILR